MSAETSFVWLPDCAGRFVSPRLQMLEFFLYLHLCLLLADFTNASGANYLIFQRSRMLMSESEANEWRPSGTMCLGFIPISSWMRKQVSVCRLLYNVESQESYWCLIKSCLPLPSGLLDHRWYFIVVTVLVLNDLRNAAKIFDTNCRPLCVKTVTRIFYRTIWCLKKTFATVLSVA